MKELVYALMVQYYDVDEHQRFEEMVGVFDSQERAEQGREEYIEYCTNLNLDYDELYIVTYEVNNMNWVRITNERF